MRPVVLLTLVVGVFPALALAAPLTADDAVKIALQKSGSIVQSQASVLSARSGLWSAYSRVMPSVSGDYSRNGQFTRESIGTRPFGALTFVSSTADQEGFSHSYGVNGRWSVFDPSGIAGLSSARSGMKAANLGHRAARADVRLNTKRQFYATVKAMHLARVSSRALRLARDDERRVRALFEVGSVSKSDLLKAQVRTAQAQLDSLLSDHAVITQRLALAEQIGIPERDLGDVDSTLSAEHETLDPAGVLEEARKNRPDLLAAEADARAAELGLRSAHWARFPALVLTGGFTPKSVSTNKQFADFSPHDTASTTRFESKDLYSGSLSVSISLFDEFAISAGVAAARSRLLSARETRNALLRNLEGEVRQTLLGYQEAAEREALARRTVESASENLNLVQQKYNVGSATILDLVDSQVQLQQAQSDLVSALADIRVAEAAVDRVRGKGE